MMGGVSILGKANQEEHYGQSLPWSYLVTPPYLRFADIFTFSFWVTASEYQLTIDRSSLNNIEHNSCCVCFFVYFLFSLSLVPLTRSY